MNIINYYRGKMVMSLPFFGWLLGVVPHDRPTERSRVHSIHLGQRRRLGRPVRTIPSLPLSRSSRLSVGSTEKVASCEVGSCGLDLRHPGKPRASWSLHIREKGPKRERHLRIPSLSYRGCIPILASASTLASHHHLHLVVSTPDASCRLSHWGALFPHLGWRRNGL